MNDKAQKPILFLLLTGLIVAVIVLTLMTLRKSSQIEHFEKERHQSIVLADWLRQSSDDLTKFSRTYIITGDTIWEEKYRNVIAVRKGEKPWKNKNIISLRDSMSKLGFTEREFELLTKAENNSNELVWSELTAFNAMKGIFADSTKQFTRKQGQDRQFATKILFDDKYHADKKAIMAPIFEFYAMIDHRTQSTVDLHKVERNRMVIGIVLVLLLIATLVAYIIFIIQRRLNVELVKSNRAKQDAENLVKTRTEQILKSKKKLETLIKVSNTGAWTWHADREFLDCTNEYFSMLGRDQVEFDLSGNKNLKETWIDLLHPDDRSRAAEQFADYLASGSSDMYESFFRMLHANGHYVWIWSRGATLRDENGKPSSVTLGTHIDITKQKEIEDSLKLLTDELEDKVKERTKQLEKERKFLQELLDTSPIAVAISSLDTAIKYVNKTMTALYGLKEGDLGFNRFVNSKDVEYIVSEVSNDRSVFGYAMEVYGQNNEKVEMLANYIPIEYKGEPSILAWHVDITNLKETERQLQHAKEIAEEATKEKSAFLASMSHEIRTPMNAVIGLSYLALQTNLTPKQHDYIYKIQSSGKALLGIINDILDFSKIEAGKLTIENTNFDLEKVMNDVATVITYKAHEKGLEIVFDISPDVPLLLIGDPLRIGQIIINLANNAVKFTNDGEIVLKIELNKQTAAKSSDDLQVDPDSVDLKFTVTDTGIGIEKKNISNLFKSFTQADRSTSRRFGGTGLGLTICRNLVEMLGGEIAVESELGKGSSFFFNIKLRKQKEQKSLVTSFDLRKMKVLVCDDNLTSLEVLTSMLKSFTLRVKAVTSGEEALLELEKEEPDSPYELVILDWKMPGLDGLEVAEKIKLNKKLEKIPTIIMVTAYTREQIIHKVEELELEGLLTKPVSHSTMFDTIMDAFGKEISQKQSDKVASTKYEKYLNKRKGARVLLVEDNEINQQVAAEIIESAGLIVEIANNGLEAINRLNRSSDFDMIFMDIQMPIMDGITAAEKIRHRKEFDSIPIVAMTADVVAEVKERCLKIGMNEFITKPISPESVFESIIKWIKPGNRDLSQLKQKKVDNATESIMLPDLENINTVEGLSRVNGNKKLYQSLLFKFYNNNVNLIEQIKNAFEKGNQETVLRLVHTVKGVSGNIGANELHLATKKLESKLKEGNYEDLDTLLDEYQLSLSSIFSAIEAYKNTLVQTKIEQTVIENESELDEKLFVKLIGELKELLEDNDLDAKDTVGEILKLPGLNKYRKQIEMVEEALNNYNFEGALAGLKNIT